MLTDDFRTNLRIFMRRDSVTQIELAKRLDVSQAYVSQILNGYHDPGLGVIERIAHALNIRPSMLFKEVKKSVK